jgi:anti-anti-sigma factor
MLAITQKPEPPGVTLIIQGDLNAVTSPDLERSLTALLSSDHAHVVVDLAGVSYVSSAGLRVFLVCAKQAKRANRGLALCQLQAQILQLFDCAGMTPLFPMHPTADDAHAALRQRAAAK